MTEIKGPAPLPATGAMRPVVSGTELTLKLLQPLQGLLVPGESARAEVLEVRNAGPDLQVVLRLTLPSGREATLEARANVPVNLGSAYTVTALAQNRVLAQLQPAGAQPLDALDLDLLPVGSQIQARVLGSQPLEAAQQGFRLLLGLLGGPLAGTRLLVDSARAMPTGSLLTALVKGGQSLSFVPLSGRLDQLALNTRLNDQFARQGSLQALLQTAGSPGNPPPAVGQALQQLLGALPEFEAMGNASKLAQALGTSGLFMEAGALADGGEALPADLKANLLRLVGQLLPNLPGSSPLATAQSSLGLGQALPAFARQMLGALGQAPRQQALDFPLPSRLLAGLDGEADLETLLKLAAAAIARLQTHQLASLAQTQTTPEGLQLTTWQMELPLRNGGDIVPLQAWVQREEDSEHAGESHRETVWRLELAFDLAPLGPLQVQAQLSGGSLSSQLWAERPATAELIDGELAHLRERLEGAGLQVGALDCRQGTPPQGRRTRIEQHFVDEKA